MMQGAAACDAASGKPVGNIVSLEGVVELRSATGQQVAPEASAPSAWVPARLQQPVCANDQVAVREHSRAAIQLVNQVVVRLEQHTTLTLQKIEIGQPAQLGLLQGMIHVLTRFTQSFSVITPYLNAMVDGTEFTVLADVTAQRGQVTVSEGKVRAANGHGEQVLLAGNSVSATALESPPVPLTVKPRDAIQWALYYPQIVRLDDAQLESLDESARSTVRAAQQSAQRGQFAQALLLIDQSPAVLTTPALHAWHANLLLSVGRLDEARAELADAPNLPLSSLIETVLGNSQSALQLAQQSIVQDANSAPAQLALSWAAQAMGDIPAATVAAQRATELDSQFASAWVRLAELELLNAQARDGRRHAQRALQIEADTLRAHTVIGFAELMVSNYELAAQSFERARQAASPDAQAWLGGALVLIHDGNIAAGREQLEVAAMLDPGNAELRNILARAYALEKRDAVADKELSLAQRLDPNNPGPWFTEAMFKQQRNDPVSALNAYEQSLELNDNKAVVRPRSLLDQDKAGRMVSLASVYRDLGFDGLMLATASRAVEADPGSAAAHAFLAEAYAGTPNYETARVSEQLQAQLRAPIGMAPVPPASLVTTLPIVGGARAFTLQEFTPLLDRNRAGLSATVLWGNEVTRGTSVSAFKAWDKVQLSLGHFYYGTDIASDDRPIRITLNNALLQVQVIPELQLQVEGRTERRDGGDVTQRINPSSGINPLSAEPERRRYLKNDSARFGLMYQPSANTQWLLSAVHRERFAITQDIVVREFPDPPDPVIAITHIKAELPTNANFFESQVDSEMGAFRLIVGGSMYRDTSRSNKQASTDTFDLLIDPPELFDTEVQLSEVDQSGHDKNAYFYSTYHLRAFTADVGLVWDQFDSADGLNFRQVSPKVGGSYSWASTYLHAAWFSGVKGRVAKEQSIEPTQFSGFGQLVDGLRGTQYRAVAAGLEHQWSEEVSGGLTMLRRNLDIPNHGCRPPCFGQWTEQVHGAHIDIALNSRWALDIQAKYSSFRLRQFISLSSPVAVRYWRVPTRVTYMLAGQWRIAGECEWIKQSVTTQQISDRMVTRTSFGLCGMETRYGGVSDRWSVTLKVDNLFDHRFRYQGNEVSNQLTVPQFYPTRAVTLLVGLKL